MRAGREYSVRYYFPNHLLKLVAQIAAIHEHTTAIDPCCEDVALIGHCDFVPERKALFRSPLAMEDAAIRFADVDRELHDITRTPFTQTCNLVVSCVPFGEKRRVEGQMQDLDRIASERCLDLLAPNGVALILVPLKFLTVDSYSDFRERVLAEFSLDAVIEFPMGSLFDNTAVGGALLVIRRGNTRECGTLMSAYDIKKVTTVVTSLREGIGDSFVSTDQLPNRWGQYFHEPLPQDVEDQFAEFETKRLEEIGEIIGPYRPAKTRGVGPYLVVSPRHLSDKPFTLGGRDKFLEDDGTEAFSRSIIRHGDVIVSLYSPQTYVYQSDDPTAVVGPSVAVIRAKDNEYISSYLNTESGKELFSAQTNRNTDRGVALPRLSMRDLRAIRIPIIPLNDLNSVSDKAIISATEEGLEALEALHRKLLAVKQQLEYTEAELAKERERNTPGDFRFLDQRMVQVQKGVDLILQNQEAHGAKLDEIVQVLSSMRDDIGEIKNSARDDEEKLARICKRLDRWDEMTQSQNKTLDEYIAVVQHWLGHWELLEEMTKTFLPSAEHLYDALEKLDATDFSPFIVQYCRAFENEILAKLFIAYHEDVQDRVSDIPAFVAVDLEVQKTAKFAKCLVNDRRTYTLGDMNWIMQLIKSSSKTLSSSELMKDFRAFVLKYFDDRIAEKQFLGRIKKVTDDFRNKAAHPYIINKDMADECLSLVRMSLSEFLNSCRMDPPGSQDRLR